MFSKRSVALVALACLAVITAACVTGRSQKVGEKAGNPLKVYILAGQSNMQGHASPRTIPRMALSAESKALHDKLVDADGKPRVHENVYITAISQDGGYGVPPTDQAKHGLLTVGYGNHLKTDSTLGPELGFGVTMGELVGEPILLIKTSWGGKSLNYNFRPPSAGNSHKPYTKEEIEELKVAYEAQKERHAKGRGRKPKEVAELIKKREAQIRDCGKYYRMMMAHIKEVLADPGKYCPAYDPKQGYEVAGFAWFQGYNDRFAGPPYDFYSDLLGHLIRDMRKELNAPNMRVAIGVIGINGYGKGADIELRHAMAAPAEWPEFRDNVAAVHTADFWDDEMVAATKRVFEANNIWQTSEHWTSIGKIAPKDRQWHYTSFELDPEKQYRAIKKGEEGDERTLTAKTPQALKGWLEPGFDTSKWQKGPAPIGKDARPENKRKNPQYWEEGIRSPWGDGNMLLMRTKIELKQDNFVRYRLRIRSTRSFLVYLNGQMIKDYPWWKHNEFRVFDLTEEQAELIKQEGPNVLAFYGNIAEPGSRAVNMVDLMLEGITQKQLDDLNKKMDAVRSQRDIALSKGRSNAGFHYNGSAYTYSRIGEALAKAIAGLGARG